MHIITQKRLKEFTAQHEDATSSLETWRRAVERALWKTPAEMKSTFRTADIVGHLTVFNIAGNKYRLVTAINYARSRVYIRAILTHTEYNTNKWKNDPWYENAPFLR